MRSGFILAVMITFLFGGGYFYYVAQAICPAPLTYSIGEVDESFGLTFNDLRLALSDAENVWEDAVGQNLFIYDEEARFSINLIYDERQATTDAEGEFKDRLDQTETVTGVISQRYQQLVSSYNDLQIVYSDKVEKYEQNLTTYNAEVASYNKKGGVTQSMYDALEVRKNSLDAEQASLNTLSEELNELVREINDVGARGNSIVETYNRGVQEYNNTFGEAHEFTQGTYRSDGRIDVYSFVDTTELRLVLAHEFGHALSLDHVANEKSVMYFLMGGQSQELELTQEDTDEFIRVCSTRSFWDTIKERVFNK